MNRRTIIKLAGLASAAGLIGCLSPTLPLPPPSEPDGITASDEDGVWNVRGNCTPGATVLIKNLETGVIAGTEDKDRDGRYFIRVDGRPCDHAEVWELVGESSSGTTFFVLQPVSNSLPSDDSCGGSASSTGGSGGAGGASSSAGAGGI